MFYLLIFLFFDRYDLIIGSINIAFYTHSLRYGGVERVISLLINLISKERYFNIYLITDRRKSEGDYKIPNNIKRICLLEQNKKIIDVLKQDHIDIIVYNFYDIKEIKKLNSLKKTKTIIYNHSSFLFWVFCKIYNFKKTPYPAYKNSKYVISLIPVENDYLFKKWGINSILMDNPSTFEYHSVVPSDLSSKNIIMIGRIEDPLKRFDLGIRAMESIIKEIPDCEMQIISSNKNHKYKDLIRTLKLEEKVMVTGYVKNVEIYLKNASLHIFPSISESYGMALDEVKIFGIPSIICGLDFLTLSKDGTVIIYDDNPDTIAKEAVKILKNETYRKILGKEARNSINKQKNELIAKKWKKLLLTVYKGDDESYTNLNSHKIMTKEEADKILNNQLLLLKRRFHRFNRLTLEKLKSYSFL